MTYGRLLKIVAAIDEIESMDLYRRDFEWSHTTMDRLRTRPGKGALLSSIAAVKLAAGPDEDEVDLIGALKPKAPRPGKRRGDPGPGLEHWLEEVIVAAGVPWADEPHEPPHRRSERRRRPAFGHGWRHSACRCGFSQFG